MRTIQPESLNLLIESLKKQEYRVLGPKVRDGAIVLDDIDNLSELPRGFHDEQKPGYYRLEQNGSQPFFEYVVGPQSWKKYLHEPFLKLYSSHRDKKGIHIIPNPKNPVKMAFIGIRPCELAAISIQDKVFMEGQFSDEFYCANRRELFTLAVNCSHPSSNCFCTSMNTGPSVQAGFDLSLTEVSDSGQHYFLVQVGSPRGEQLLAGIPHTKAQESELEAGNRVLQAAEERISKQLNIANLHDLFSRNGDSPYWDEVGRKCLACTNCTLVCPTCFCSTVEEVTDLKGEHAERRRQWDSCFTRDFSYLHGGSIRSSIYSRYRQWMTHKLSNWMDQFGKSGCVGCGRCITWCPVGIDITQEVEALRTFDVAGKSS
jgi:ferredoxin